MREQMIEKGASRSYVNECTRNIRHVFRWGVGEALVPPEVLHALEAVRGLKAGRTKAHELPPIVPVPEKHIEAVRPHVSRQVAYRAGPTANSDLRALSVPTGR